MSIPLGNRFLKEVVSGVLTVVITVNFSWTTSVAAATGTAKPAVKKTTSSTVSKPRVVRPFDLNKFNDSIFFTINPKTKTKGPVYSQTTASEYIQGIFGILLQKADSYAKEMYKPDRNDNFYYHTFLMLALTVPHHESQLMHYREVHPAVCSQKTNSLARMHRANVRSKMQSLYRKPTNPIFPNCTAVASEPTVNQVISSGNYDDLGLMQINPHFHPQTVLPETLLNLFNFADYGVGYLDQHFKEVYFNTVNKRYSCTEAPSILTKGQNVKLTNDGKTYNPNIYWNMIRGTWGGGYNQGNTSPRAVCRMARANGWDSPFLKSLELLAYDEKSIYHKYLPEGSDERLALEELLHNFKLIFKDEKNRPSEKRASIDKVLKKSYDLDATFLLSGLSEDNIQGTHFLKNGNINFRSSPTMNPSAICGLIKNSQDKIPQIKVIRVESQKDPYSGETINWAEVQFSKKSGFIEGYFNDQKCYSSKTFYVNADLISTVVNLKPNFKEIETFVVKNSLNEGIKILSAPSVVGSIESYIQPSESARGLGVVINPAGRWYKVQMGNGKVGYVKYEDTMASTAQNISADSTKNFIDVTNGTESVW